MGKAHASFGNTQQYLAKMLDGFGGRINTTLEGPMTFEVEVSMTAAQVIAGDVTILADSKIPTGYRLYITDYRICFNGSAFGQDVIISDNNSSAVDIVTVAAANTTGLKKFQAAAQTGVTQGTPLTQAAGCTAGKGLRLRSAATNSNGGTTIVYLRGYVGT